MFRHMPALNTDCFIREYSVILPIHIGVIYYESFNFATSNA